MKLVTILALTASLTFCKSTGRYKVGGFSSGSRNGSSSPRMAAPTVQRVKINTGSLSGNRIAAPAPSPASPKSVPPAVTKIGSSTPTATRIGAPAATAAAAGAILASQSQALAPQQPTKINTSSLSNRGQPAPAPVAAQAQPIKAASTPQNVETKVITRQTTIRKTVVVHHWTPAPVIVVGGHDMYNYHGHHYPIYTYDDGRRYAEVDGRPVYLSQNNGSWQQDAPTNEEVVMAQPAPVVQEPVLQPKVSEPKSEGMSGLAKFLLWTLAIAIVGGVAYVIYVLIRGDR